MAILLNTIRANLIGLFGWLGVVTLCVLVWNLGVTVRDQFHIRDALRSAEETDVLFRLSYALRQEDMAMLQALGGTEQGPPPEVAARATDQAIAATETALTAHAKGGHDVALTLLQTIKSGLEARRAAAMAAVAGDPALRPAALRRWRSYLDAAYPELESISHDLIRESGSAETRIATVSGLRHYTAFAYHTVLTSRFAIETSLGAAQGQDLGAMLRGLHEAAAGLRGAARLAEDQFLSDTAPAFGQAEMMTDFLLKYYLAAEEAVLADLQAGVLRPAVLDRWRARSREAVARLEATEAAFAAEAAERLGGAEARALAAIVVWLSALLLAQALLFLAVRFTLRRIVTPLEKVHAKMLRLAQGNLSVEIRSRPRLAEIQAMYDALAVFKENGLRRERMQAELARLNDRVVSANHDMTAELEAAARVQAAQLPAPCDVPGARFHAFYRPSRMIAGDSYDVVTLPDGRSRFFQIDVSGHGAAAALVSVMSHLAVKTALEQAAPEESLASIVGRVNAGWKEDLPYFTLLLVEIDPRIRLARVVQAGHPPLLRMTPGGEVQTVGDGGLPVGALPWAEYEEITCPFRPGDRLLLTTDGVTEAADASGALFGDDRYLDLLARHGRCDVPALFASLDAALWDWCGTEAFDDDVTLLILEAREADDAD